LRAGTHQTLAPANVAHLHSEIARLLHEVAKDLLVANLEP
jgi:hypothetical protein